MYVCPRLWGQISRKRKEISGRLLWGAYRKVGRGYRMVRSLMTSCDPMMSYSWHHDFQNASSPTFLDGIRPSLNIIIHYIVRPNDPHGFLIRASWRQQWRRNVKIFKVQYLQNWARYGLGLYWWPIGSHMCCFEWSRDRWRQRSLWRHTEKVMKSRCSKCVILQNASSPRVLNRIRRSSNIMVSYVVCPNDPHR